MLLRAELLRRVRTFFLERGVLEVETPILSLYASTDPALESLAVTYRVPGCTDGRTYYLQTSPELSMKRLLAAGTGPIFQVCKVFRGGERGRRHNPEFSLLEWYRPGFTYGELMDEVAALVQALLDRPDLNVERMSYRDLFLIRLGCDPHGATRGELQALAAEQGIEGVASLGLSRDGWLDLLLTHCIESDLGRGQMTFVYDYPETQAALARVRQGSPGVAERFELYLEGMELANGFQELTDPQEQRRRFAKDQAIRSQRGPPLLAMDERFLTALEAGMPESAGVALGLDRLLMVMTGADCIDAALAFPWERA